MSNPRLNKLSVKKTKERFLRVRKAGKVFERQLRAVAKQIGNIILGFAPDGKVENMSKLEKTLEAYSELLGPWAENISERMIAEVNQRDEKAWIELGREIGRGLAREMRTVPMQGYLQRMKQEQVQLIKSLPIKASERVHKLSTEAVISGFRAKEVQKEILRSGEVTKSRAMLIARTEVARTQAMVMQARAETAGSVSYIWRTAHDSDVRAEHKKLEGKVFNWNDPPVIGSNGERGNPGTIYNCRCYAEPILPE